MSFSATVRDSAATAKLKLTRTLTRNLGRCITEHALIEDGDHIMVAVSGGKDSYALLTLLEDLRSRAPVRYTLTAVHVDQGHPGYDGTPLRRWMQAKGFRYEVLEEDTYSIVTDKVTEGKTYCSLCSRLRRGILYSAAERLGCNKLALGHHREDTLETLLLNLFFGGKLAAMPAKLQNEAGNVVVIRPLLYCAEADLATFAEHERFPILPCNLCGSQTQAQRQQMKALLERLDTEHPHLKQNMLAALANVSPTHLLDDSVVRAPTARDAKRPALASTTTNARLPILSADA